MFAMRAGIAGVLGVWTMTSGIALGQPPLPYRTPTVSPYLNLLRTGSPPAVNYYNLVRPQTEFNSAIQQLQQQVGTNRQGLSDLQQQSNRTTTTLPPTGFVPQFQSQRSYFLTYGGTSMPGGIGGGGQIPNRGSGGGLPRALGVPALGSPGTGGIGSLRR